MGDSRGGGLVNVPERGDAREADDALRDQGRNEDVRHRKERQQYQCCPAL